jgi:DNA primase
VWTIHPPHIAQAPSHLRNLHHGVRQDNLFQRCLTAAIMGIFQKIEIRNKLVPNYQILDHFVHEDMADL